jgi:hypothetical protein
MTSAEIRITCLQMAMQIRPDAGPAEIISVAEWIHKFVLGPDEKAEG